VSLVHFRIRISLFVLIWFSMAGCTASTPSNRPEVVAFHLMASLNDPNPDSRRTAALSLGKIASPESAQALIQSLHDADPLVRQYSAWALGNLGGRAPEEVGEALVPLLLDPSSAVAMAAAEAIGKTAAEATGKLGFSQKVVGHMTAALRNPSVNTRRAAVSALTWLESGSAYSALVQALNDPDAQVRQGALAALGELGDHRAVTAIRDRLMQDSAAGVRSEAAYRLGKLGDQTVVPALQTVAAKDTVIAVRRWARWAIEQLSQTDELGSVT
jgi:HEAT repeat protein